MKTWMVIDMANIIFRVWASHGGAEVDTAQKLGLAMHSVLRTTFKWYKKYRPDKLAFSFEGGKNWRKAYMNSEKAVRKTGYKAHRVSDPGMESLFSLIDDFRTMMTDHSSAICLHVPGYEGDDVIAAFCEIVANAENRVVVISSDKDFIQLKRLENVEVIDPATGLDRAIDKKTGKRIDPNWYIFEKCFRGDLGDGVFSAYPKLRTTKIEEAFRDPEKKAMLFEHRWTDADGTEYRVGDLFNENRILVDLFSQPDDIRETLIQSVYEKIGSHGKYSHFHFLKLLGKHDLKNIAEQVDQFIPMLSANSSQEDTNSLLVM